MAEQEANAPGSTNEGFIYRVKLPRLIKDLDALTYDSIRDSEIGDQLYDLHSRVAILLNRLQAALKSEEYPCPICASRSQDPKKIGILTLHFDIEYDEYYPISATPYLTGTCTDEVHSFGMIRPRSSYRIGQMLPFNHSEQINEALEDANYPEELGYILGAAQERRRLCEALGIEVKRWG